LVLAALLALPGVVLIIFTQGWAHAIGIVLVVLAGPPAVVAAGLFLSSLVARWAARHRSFA
jgi:membrane protein implicated in regulation of membrane protease activity